MPQSGICAAMQVGNFGAPLLFLRDQDIEHAPASGPEREYVVIRASPGTVGDQLAEQLDPLAQRVLQQIGGGTMDSLIKTGRGGSHDRIFLIWSMKGPERSRLYDGSEGLDKVRLKCPAFSAGEALARRDAGCRHALCT